LPHVAARGSARPSQRAAAKKPDRLGKAKADLAALVRDRTRRRYRHHWERAIAGLLQAAHGKDRGPALLEAARARYALYRWSADEADRVQALALAARAQRAGAGEARTLAQAILQEAGDDERPVAPARRSGTRATPPAERPHATASAEAPSAPPGRPGAAAEPDEEADPALDRVMAALGDAAPASATQGPPEQPPGPARVSEVKAWSSPDYTRVAVYLSHWVPWQQLELPADGVRPRRLAVDLSPALLAGRTLVQPLAGAQVARVRAAQNAADSVRVVLDLAGKDGVKVFRMDDPPRLVLDVGKPVGAEPPAVAEARPAADPGASSSASPAAPAEAPGDVPGPGADANGQDTRVELPARALAALRRGPAAQPGEGGEAGPAGPREVFPVPEGDVGDRPIRRIVVDAGHGGHDPGAIGPSRVREKDVTLAISRRLARKLRAAGFAVVLTRDSDRFVALEERTAIANAAKADLFVSVHANAHPRRSRTGVETYFLNVTDDRYASRLAARENGVDLSAAGDVARILTDLDAKASAGASVRLARNVQREVCGGVRARVGDVRDLGVKSALFYVLLGARMPAVLVETGFISNRVEERRLATSTYQDEVASGIARAVQGFARGETQVAAVR
jgi:N-acetylmuramoyl-L-alanine amidase